MSTTTRPETPSEQGESTESSPGSFSFLYDLTTAPCFRQATLLGLGGGGAIGALNGLRNRDPMRGAEMMIKSGCAVAMLSWIACRKRYYDEREETYAAMEKVRETQRLQAAIRAKQMREKKERLEGTDV